MPESDNKQIPRGRWVFRKEISLANVFTFILLVAGLFLGYFDLLSNDIEHQNGLNSLTTIISHEKELQGLRDLNQDDKITEIYDQIEDAREEFRVEHQLTRAQVVDMEKETRKMIINIINNQARGNSDGF